jgi:Rrf2 family protein
LLDLSLSDQRSPVLIQDIADRQNIPLKYLQQILVTLKLAGFVRSRKGPGGGYTLARLPERITLGQVLRAIEGTFVPVGCMSEEGRECDCPKPEECALRDTYEKVSQAISAAYDNTTFAELRDRQAKLSGRESAINFVI